MPIKPEHRHFARNAAQMLADGNSLEYVKDCMRALGFDREQCDELVAEAAKAYLDLRGGIIPKIPDYLKPAKETCAPSEESALQRALALLASDDSDCQSQAVGHLRELCMRSPALRLRALTALRDAFNNESVLVRAVAVKAVVDLSPLSDDEFDQLRSELLMPSGGVAAQVSIASYLGQICDERSLEPLLAVAGTASSYLAQEVAVALGRTGSLDAVPPLIDMLDRFKDRVAGMNAGNALQEITGQRFYMDSGAWRCWWDQQSMG